MNTSVSSPARSLSARLLILTVLFVFVAEIVVLIPSVSKQRIDWFHMRIDAAYLVSVALENPEARMISEEQARTLFETAGIRGVTVRRGDSRVLVFAPEIDPHGSANMHRVELTTMNPITLIANAWGTIFSSGDALVQVNGTPKSKKSESMDIIVSQKALREDLRIYARNILGLSLLISTLTAALLFYAFNSLIVRPVKRLTRDMGAFESDPDKASLIHIPSDRIDEIGAAERSLAMMQQRLHELLLERRRLAALGAGISKISHDLRNILASAQLMSDRLAKSDDPAVRKLSPRLIGALDRAIVLSRDTLAFGRMAPENLDKASTNLSSLANEVIEDAASIHVAGENIIPEGLNIVADRTQLYRALFNIAKNATEAMAAHHTTANGDDASDPQGKLIFSTEETANSVRIRITDNGPGLPDHAIADLFEPFKGSQKPGGSGLGVAISAEIARAHGGELVLERSDENGAVFMIRLPK